MLKNVTFNKRDKVYVVKTPNGKKKVYKTLKGAEAYARKKTITVKIPKIVTANTFFWKSAQKASGRRFSEQKHNTVINDFMAVFTKIPSIEVSGDYSETCSHVYKRMFYDINGKATNITGIIGESARYGIVLVKE